MKILTAAAFLFLALPFKSEAARLTRGPYLENMTRDMVTVRFKIGRAHV